MKIQMAAYYTDGRSKIVEFEKPPGAHPDSDSSFRAGIIEAERQGGVVSTIARFRIVNGITIDTIKVKRNEIIH